MIECIEPGSSRNGRPTIVPAGAGAEMQLVIGRLLRRKIAEFRSAVNDDDADVKVLLRRRAIGMPDRAPSLKKESSTPVEFSPAIRCNLRVL